VRSRLVTRWAFLDEAGSFVALAHRGGAAHPELVGLENTLRAFRHATTLGYDYLETDVHVTRDGVLIAFHDDELDRVTNASGTIALLAHADILAARIADTEQIPTLRQLLQSLPQARFNIDLKSDATVTALAALIDETGAHQRVLVGSFSHSRLKHFRRLLPQVATSASPWEVAILKFVPVVWLADYLVNAAVAALQVPRFKGPLEVVTTRFVRRMHAINKQVHVWTIDDAPQMELLICRGVDGLITDRTDILKAVLINHGLWKEQS
jgi:glycerophosphoryl diester phosphodiesterase